MIINPNPYGVLFGKAPIEIHGKKENKNKYVNKTHFSLNWNSIDWSHTIKIQIIKQLKFGRRLFNSYYLIYSNLYRNLIRMTLKHETPAKARVQCCERETVWRNLLELLIYKIPPIFTLEKRKRLRDTLFTFMWQLERFYPMKQIMSLKKQKITKCKWF